MYPSFVCASDSEASMGTMAQARRARRRFMTCSSGTCDSEGKESMEGRRVGRMLLRRLMVMPKAGRMRLRHGGPVGDLHACTLHGLASGYARIIRRWRVEHKP